MNIDSSIFKAYDIRGIYPQQLDEKGAYAIGRAYAQFLKPKKVVIGRDVRLSGESLMNAFIVGLQEEGVEVTEIEGQITTELIYFASGFYDFDGAVSVTASHNPREYNGFKMCRSDAEIISGDTGIQDIKKIVQTIEAPQSLPNKRPTQTLDVFDDYFDFLKDHFITDEIVPLKLVGDSNFGMQATVLKKLVARFNLPLDIYFINEEPDGSFPKGRPDPMIPSNRDQMSKTIKEKKVDLGVAWDADADRCFFYDHNGDYIDPYYLNALLIEFILNKNPEAKIYHDPRLKWLAQDIAHQHNTDIIFAKSGSAFIKLLMRREGIDFGAEVTAHYFFKDFFFSDSGLIPLLWVGQILTLKKQTLGALVAEYTQKYAKSDEILFKVASVPHALTQLSDHFSSGSLESIDGISYEFDSWRFNARGSNTEPLLKINIEAKSPEVVREKSEEIIALISNLGGSRVIS